MIASYYALFAVMGASTRTLIIESIVAGVFVLFAVLGFKGNYWLVVAALIGHGVFDFVRHFFIDNPGVPQWWPGFCLASDVVFGVFLTVCLINQPERVSFSSAHSKPPRWQVFFDSSIRRVGRDAEEFPKDRARNGS